MNHSNLLIQAVENHGAPLYVYDADYMTQQYNRFKNAFQVPRLDIHYACKALSNPEVLKHFKALGSGLDCVSIEEVKLGLYAGFQPQEILFTPNNVSESEFDEAIALGVKLNVDNLSMLEYLGVNHPQVPVCIRLNPHVMGGGNAKISVGHIDSKFGISIHQVPLVKRIVDTLNIPVEGLHVHTGSDILSTDIFLRAAELVFEVAREFPTISYLDFGSGFKVKYSDTDIETDIEAFGQAFSKRFNAFCEEIGRELVLCFEPGKFMVSEAGTFLSQVNVVKQTTACTFVGLDSGFNHFIRPMFYDAHHEVYNLTNPEGDKKVYTVTGYICETDTFGWNRLLNEVRKGDVLAFKNAGAYCFSMASNYNSRRLPAEVLLKGGEVHLIRRRQTFDDLLSTCVPTSF